MEVGKNMYYNQEINEKDKSLKLKIFEYFYIIIINKSQISLVVLLILHTIEIVQLLSFAFSYPHLFTWKLPINSIKMLNMITSSFRLAPLLNLVKFQIYAIVFFIILVIIFLCFLFLIFQFLSQNNNSKIYLRISKFLLMIIPPITILLFLPINELFFMPLNCNTNKVFFNSTKIKCWNSTHLIYVSLGIIAALIFFIFLLFINNFFFYPFSTIPTTLKLNPNTYLLLLIIKFIYVLNFTLIKNEFISIAILLIFSLFLLYQQFIQNIYNLYSLDLFLNIRNILLVWTYFMLFIAQICVNSKINNLIYLLLFGYPIVAFSFVMFYKKHKNTFIYNNSSVNNVDTCISKVKIIIKLIDSFLNDKNNNLKFNENGNQENDILLKGYIQTHIETCLKEECPLTKFIKNNGNYNIQKQCLLNYMSIFFNNSIKKFPHNIFLRLSFIHFNIHKKYNLNCVRANLEEVKKMKSSLNEQFILYCLEKEILKSKLKDTNDGSEVEKENIIVEQHYKRLKDLISNCTKLYVEFWGIFATNITNNLNNIKLYKLGEKLNVILKDINYLWENKLKNKKIEIENESNAQLYSRFLREILWDKKKSELVLKKINEEHNILLYNKIIEDKTLSDNLDNMIENQDYTLFVSTNDKGKCNIIQFSNSLTYLIGYQKLEIINKPLEFLMPSIFVDGHSKKVEEYINNYHFRKNSDNNSFRESDKNKHFILIKNKMGYIIPFNAQFTIFDDNDFSNSFVIKAKLEPRDAKSTYAYYILAKPDLSVESISSSAIHLGLTMDLLKKYVIKLNILVRNSKNNLLNLFDRYKEYEEDTKKITWIYPDIIYPKNDILKNKDAPIQDLIKVSRKNKFNLQIIEMKFYEEEITGFLFRFTEIQKKNKKKENQISPEEMIPPFKNEILFDLMKLNYIRTILVQKKSGFRNLRENEEEENKNNISISIDKKKKKKAREDLVFKDNSSDEENNEIILTKERIIELQTRDSNGIKAFIKLLPFYGSEISLIKHRPNKEKYPAGKAQEPLIKIDASNYTKRIESRIRENPELYRKFRIRQKEKTNLNSNSIKASFNNYLEKQDENNQKEIGEVNRDLGGYNSFSLINIFDIKSIKTIKVVDLLIYLFLIVLSILEFILSFTFLKNNMKRFSYLNSSYKLLNDVAYTKYFITEAILSNNMPNYKMFNFIEKEKYFSLIKDELSNYRQDLSDTINEFTNSNIDFSKEYKDFTSNTNITIKILSNGNEKEEQQPFFSAINKLTTSIFYISTITNNSQINMESPYSFELMVNLLSGYYIAFETLNEIMFEDYHEKTENAAINNFIIFLVTIVFSILVLFIFWKMMAKLNNDREKPINLFLTIKKKIFEDLKNSAESFSNKLLNKFFGVDENEEESQQDHKINVKANDINIAKFKALNEYKALNNNTSSFISYFLKLLLFLLIFNCFTLAKYITLYSYHVNVDRYLKVYNSTQFSQIYLITRIDIIKQYLFNKSIIAYNNTNGIMINTFLTLADEFQNTLKEISKTKCFLRKAYRESFRNFTYGDFSRFVPRNNYYITLINITKKAENGFKYINLEIFEMLRFIVEKYFGDEKRNNETQISEFLNETSWLFIHQYLISLIRPWYKYINILIKASFFSEAGGSIKNYILNFILILIYISLFYWILWKRYENHFIVSIKKSFDLINLIPEEIKNIIVNKLNE